MPVSTPGYEPKNISDFINTEQGLISREIFVDEDIYRQELDRIFGRCWLLLAHESQLKKPGDYFATWMGEDPVVVVKGRDGQIRALLNSCRHRGMPVCRAEVGNTKAFTCTYHGWAYNLDGDLINVPYEEEGYRNAIDKSKWGMIPVTRVENYKGLIFGSWDPDVPPLEEYLGEMAWYLDAFLDRREGGTEVIGGVLKWRVEGNWKLAAEQFASDNYHAPISHASAIATLSKDLPEDTAKWGHGGGAQFNSALGHGAGFAVSENWMGKFLARGFTKELCDYYEKHWAEMTDRLGKDRMQGPLSGHANVFPTMSYLPGISTLRVWHPRGPHAMDIYAWVLVDAAASPELKDEQRRFTQLLFNASGLLEQDDGENWADIQRVLRGQMQRRFPFNYQMSMEHEWTDDPRYPGRISGYVSEAAARSFYRRYAQLMDGESFPAEPPAAPDVPSGRLDLKEPV
ncbi:aromatic ring-hydroxylating dioxygenase subunit alpha [Nocardioides sp. NPDC127514]|uniref:aromatic ring-hydroxylating dioxygenase subunit alpha n=1 Tax=unclassified Nocardioides TaxID=2615069 RepID=UPI003327FE72